MHKILVVEDDTTINQVICEFLKENHYEVTPVFDGAEALREFEEKSFDLIILDVMLPSMSGLDVLKEIRKTSQVPVMMLTALDDEYTQLVSFNHLISDYVTKPFSPLILMKRIENIFRSTVTESEIVVGDLRVSIDDCTVYWQEEKMSPTKKEYEIIQALAKRKNHLVTRDQLMNTIWGYSELDSRVLDNHVKNIRKKIPGIAGIDTRALTKIIRQHGTMKATIANVGDQMVHLQDQLKATVLPTDNIKQLSTKTPYPAPGSGPSIVLVDFGLKHSILRELAARNCNVTVVPYDTSAADILHLHPDGVMLSNGPGNPDDVPQVLEMIRGIQGKIPLFQKKEKLRRNLGILLCYLLILLFL